jgi:Tannase and feruloyl esterase
MVGGDQLQRDGGALANGYATSSTDTGHTGSSASFALGHPEKLIDFAYRSEHEMTTLSKAIIAAFYGDAPHFSYWNGCSAGGKQGLKEAQQYPGDFDGIVAGSPAANWTGRAAQALWVAQAVHKDDASYIPPQKYPFKLALGADTVSAPADRARRLMEDAGKLADQRTGKAIATRSDLAMATSLYSFPDAHRQGL